VRIDPGRAVCSPFTGSPPRPPSALSTLSPPRPPSALSTLSPPRPPSALSTRDGDRLFGPTRKGVATSDSPPPVTVRLPFHKFF